MRGTVKVTRKRKSWGGDHGPERGAAPPEDPPLLTSPSWWLWLLTICHLWLVNHLKMHHICWFLITSSEVLVSLEPFKHTVRPTNFCNTLRWTVHDVDVGFRNAKKLLFIFLLEIRLDNGQCWLSASHLQDYFYCSMISIFEIAHLWHKKRLIVWTWTGKSVLQLPLPVVVITHGHTESILK